jgi:hydroxypyruvate reductase
MLSRLQRIYRIALAECAPERLLRRIDARTFPRDVVAIGKCAGALVDGFAPRGDAFCVIPDGYRAPASKCDLWVGGHPHVTDASFNAGRALLDFVAAREEITFLISGGGSACVEQPLRPWFDERDLIDVNDRLVASDLPIAQINCVRKHLSAIKGGRLAATLRRSVTLVFSDVSTGALADVASGPTLPDTSTKDEAIAILEGLGGCDRIVARLRESSLPETVHHIDNAGAEIIADNETLVDAASRAAEANGMRVVRWPGQIECGVDEAASMLVDRASTLREGEVLIAGGEPTVARRGDGKGGRCSELAVRAALHAVARLPGDPVAGGGSATRQPGHRATDIHALFATSDGVDGSSGVAGIALTLPPRFDCDDALRQLERSNSFAVASQIGEPLTIPGAGNNLRDLYLLARSWQALP